MSIDTWSEQIVPAPYDYPSPIPTIPGVMTTFAEGVASFDDLVQTHRVPIGRPVGIYPSETAGSEFVDTVPPLMPTHGSFTDAGVEQPLPIWGDIIDHGRTVDVPASKRGRAILNALKIGVVVYEAMPGLDDVTRYALLLGSQALGPNPIVGAAVTGLSTFAVESAAVLASAKWIAEDKIGPSIEVARTKIDTFKDKLDTWMPRLRPGRFIRSIPKDRETQREALPFPIKAGIALYAGSVVLLEAMQRRDPSRTAEQNRRDGLKSAAILSGCLALEGAAISFGLANLMNPLVLIGAGAGVWGFNKLRQKLGSRAAIKDGEPAVLEQGESVSEAFRARYDLDQAELDALDRGLVADVKKAHPEEGVYVALIDPDHPYSNFVRGHEVKYFPESAKFTPDAEKKTIMFALVDTRPDSNRTVHVGTISGPNMSKSGDSGETGFLFVDDLCGRDGNFTPEEFLQRYAGELDLDSCIAVESNVKVGKTVEKFRGIQTVDLAYRTLFSFIGSERAAVFASINVPQARSFQLKGIGFEPLMGRKDLSTPEADEGRASKPVVIYNNDYTRQLFGMMGPELPIVTFDA